MSYFIFRIDWRGVMVGNPPPITELDTAKAECERLDVGTIYSGDTLASLSSCELFWFNEAWHTSIEYMDWIIADRPLKA